jgi:hypothetical protein
LEEFFEPGAGYLFDDCRGGAYGVEGGVLVPCGGEPVCGEGGGEGATVDPAEEASAGYFVEAAVDCGDEFFDDLGGIEAGVCEWDGKALAEGVERGRGGYGGDVFGCEIVEGVG